VQGLAIFRNGAKIPREAWGIEVPVDAGSYTVLVQAPCKQSRTQEVDARRPGELVVVHLEVLAAQPTTQSQQRGDEPTEAVVAAPAEAQDGGASVLGPIVLGAVGIVAVGVGVGFGIDALNKNAQAMEICVDPEGTCSSDDVLKHANLTEDARADRTIAYVGVGVGSAAVFGAMLWYVLGADFRSATGLTVTPLVGSAGWGVSAVQNF
jgi:hypothetical protein